jgi:integrase
MFYLGNRSGLRTGEIAGLRLSDLDFLDEGVIRVRFSYDGPLKEDKRGEGKVKWAPAADDCKAFLGPWLARRVAEGAGPEDHVFVAPKGACFGKVYLGRQWNPVAKRYGLKLTWYQATRHSFVSRSLSRGISLDEVSAAVGHSSPVVTRRYYDHFVRRAYR